MQYRKLGKVGPCVSAVGLGCFSFTGAYGAVTTADAMSTISRAVELGVTLFDTAAAYDDGENERFVGRALRPVRDKIVLVTKCGFGASRGENAGAAPGEIQGFCDASLQRLGFDVIDVYLMHRLNRRHAIEETVGALADLVRLGKVRAIGLPECDADTLRRAHAVWPLAAIEAEYSLSSRNVESTGLLQNCVERGIGLIAYSPLGRGMLAKPMTKDDLADNDLRLNFPRFQGENLDINRRMAIRIAALAQERGCSPTQLLLAWILAKAPNTIPIPGSRTGNHLEANARASEIFLEAEEIRLLESIVSAETIAGRSAPAGWAN